MHSDTGGTNRQA